MRVTFCQKPCELIQVALTASNSCAPVYYDCCRNCGRVYDTMPTTTDFYLLDTPLTSSQYEEIQDKRCDLNKKL